MYIVITVIALYLGSIAFVRLRNKNHFPLTRQLSDFSTFMVVFNLPAYLLSKVPLSPFVGVEHYPDLHELEENWEVIRDEAQALFDSGHIGVGDDMPGSSFYKKGRWKSFYLKSYENKIPSAYALAPNTMALIDKVPAMNMALFAALMPGKKLKWHHDPFAFTLRYSLALITPNTKESGLIVNGETYHWHNGKGVLFDETYMHMAYNNSEQVRIVLMTDVDRPLYLKPVQKIYYYFGRFFNRAFAVDNVDARYSGFGNTVGKWIIAYSNFLKAFKKRNKPLYVAFKIVTFFSIFGFIAYKLI